MGLLSWVTGSGAGSTPPRDNPWRRLYNPGTAPNPARMEGASSYDNVNGPAPSVWDCILQSETFRRKSFSDLDSDGDGYISRAELAAAVGPGADAARLIAAADTSGSGRLSRADFDRATGRAH